LPEDYGEQSCALVDQHKAALKKGDAVRKCVVDARFTYENSSAPWRFKEIGQYLDSPDAIY
jgi:hypothetical protein